MLIFLNSPDIGGPSRPWSQLEIAMLCITLSIFATSVLASWLKNWKGITAIIAANIVLTLSMNGYATYKTTVEFVEVCVEAVSIKNIRQAKSQAIALGVINMETSDEAFLRKVPLTSPEGIVITVTGGERPFHFKNGDLYVPKTKILQEDDIRKYIETQFDVKIES